MNRNEEVEKFAVEQLMDLAKNDKSGRVRYDASKALLDNNNKGNYVVRVPPIINDPIEWQKTYGNMG